MGAWPPFCAATRCEKSANTAAAGLPERARARRRSRGGRTVRGHGGTHEAETHLELAVDPRRKGLGLHQLHLAVGMGGSVHPRGTEELSKRGKMAERGFIHRNPRALDRLAALPAGGETTMGELLVNSFRQHSAAPCLATRVRNADGSAGPFEWQTYRQIQSTTGAGVFFCTRFTPLEAKVEQFASGLSELGLKRGERLGCYSPNREEVRGFCLSSILQLTLRGQGCAGRAVSMAARLLHRVLVRHSRLGLCPVRGCMCE